ncbi:MAG: hypothetical protein MK234_09165, partial [Nitrospinales bacterium]|nr:hypothetical protein [Nitrospinales bacterium]
FFQETREMLETRALLELQLEQVKQWHRQAPRAWSRDFDGVLSLWGREEPARRRASCRNYSGTQLIDITCDFFEDFVIPEFLWLFRVFRGIEVL